MLRYRHSFVEKEPRLMLHLSLTVTTTSDDENPVPYVNIVPNSVVLDRSQGCPKFSGFQAFLSQSQVDQAALVPLLYRLNM